MGAIRNVRRARTREVVLLVLLGPMTAIDLAEGRVRPQARNACATADGIVLGSIARTVAWCFVKQGRKLAVLSQWWGSWGVADLGVLCCLGEVEDARVPLAHKRLDLW